MHAYLLFHSLTEIGVATICFGTFLFAWSTWRFQNGFFRVLGASALFVGLLGTLHCLAFPGMPVFQGYDQNLSPQLWLAARIFEAAGLIAGLLVINRKVNGAWLLLGLAAACAAVLLAIFSGWVPRVVVPGGLTSFKVAAEGAIAALFLASIPLLRRLRDHFAPGVYRLLVANAAAMAACDLCFSVYSTPYDPVNFAGHLLLIGGVALQYHAVLRVGLIDPTEATFRDLARAQRELERARDRLERAQAAGRVGTFEWDLQTGGRSIIAGMEAIYGERLEDPAGFYPAWRRHVHPEDIARVEAHIAEVVAGRAEYDTEFRVLWPDGSVHWVQARGRLALDAAGRPSQLVGVNLEITERKQAEEALREADRRKSEFLAVLSHELRNPLAPIQNSLFVLERAPAGGEQAQRALAIVRRQTAHLTRLVDDLLDITRISRGKIRLQRAPLELGELVRRAAEDHRPAFAARGIAFEVQAACAPLWLDADATRIAQVVGNLLGNAAKFTPPEGRVVLALEAAGGWARLTVRDSGVGIEPAVLPRVFEPFMQADQTIDRSRGGLGLGLALVKSLVEQHGGSVRAASEGPGRGAEFELRLPLAAPGATAAQPPCPAVRPRRILVIEDGVDAGDSLREALAELGHDAHLARSGAEGLEVARRLNPEVVLCDVGLPELDGYEVARRLRAGPAAAPALLVALTGYAAPEDIARAREAGFDRHLAKPADLAAIEALLGDWAPAPEARERAASPRG